MVKYNINTKHERDSETRFPYINPSPLVHLVYLTSVPCASFESGKVLLLQALVTITELAILLGLIVFLLPKAFKLFGFQILQKLAMTLNVISTFL